MKRSEARFSQKLKIGVLGSGALGLTAALRLQEKGHEVTVIEKEETVGGLLTSLKIGDSYFEKFYHHIFQTDTVIVSLIKELGLENKLIWKPGKTGTLYKGEIYPLDSPATVLKFSPLKPFNRVRLGLVLAYLKLTKNYHQFENITAAIWLKKAIGKEAYQVIFDPLLKGKFDKNYDQITMSWFWARVFSRTQKLGYLKNGFYQLYVALEERIKKGGGNMVFGESAIMIEEKDGEVTVTTDKKDYKFDKVLVTLPTNLFFKLTPQLSPSFKEKYHWDDYFGAQTLVLTLKRKLSDYYWLNISDQSFPFLVFVEHTNFMPTSDYGGKHLIYLGNYLATTDPRFKLTPEETFKKYVPYLAKINPSFKEDWVEDYQLFRAPYAQPIVKIGYKDHIPPHTTGIKNIYLANMGQVYPWDRGQNYSIKLAQEVVEMMV